MRFFSTMPLILILIITIIDLYVFQAVRTVTSGSSDNVKRWIYFIFWLITFISILTIAVSYVYKFSAWDKTFRTYLSVSIMIVYISKILVLPFLLIDDIIRFGRWVVMKLSGPGTIPTDRGDQTISRSVFLSSAALIIAAIPFSSLTYGLIRGPYRYKVRRQRLYFANLPKSFDGLRLLQISDIHTGSFSGVPPMEHAVEMIMAEKADLILFTGDIVNSMTEEAYPFIDTLKKLNAPLGVFSSTGNHDYGDYHDWESDEAKAKNWQDLIQLHKQLGWELLRNENRLIHKDGESIGLGGSENWSTVARFPKYGDLKKTLTGLENTPFNILMSHDPTHWKAEVVHYPVKADLTLAGHTHGMQFGVDFNWFKWSPVQYVYHEWAGLYKDNNRYLYVNRGLGFIGYPGRVGVMPEITVFELKKG